MAQQQDYTLKDTVGLPLIMSAGGLVVNDQRQVLFIFKRGKWDLAKGRVEKGQNPVDTAIREVAEETGITANKIEVVGKLVPTWHSTRRKGRKYLKKTHWYLMKYSGNNDKLSPQYSEDIIECRWVSISGIDPLRPRMHSAIQYVVDFWLTNLAYDRSD